MAENRGKVSKVHYSTKILSAQISYNDRILVKDTPSKKEFAFVRSKQSNGMKKHSCKDNQNQIDSQTGDQSANELINQPVNQPANPPANPPVDLMPRRVFLISISFQSYGGIFSGTSMMSYQIGQDGQWPLLEENIHVFRYWILCIVNDDGDSIPTRAQLLNADFFDCPQEPLYRLPSCGDNTRMFKLDSKIVKKIEAIQELGRTSASNHVIERERDKLNGLWGSYYAILWNSQQFAIRLAYLILEQEFLSTARIVLKRLLFRIEISTGHFVVVRHLGCMAAFLGLGIVTGGIGAFAAWSTAGGSMVSHDFKMGEISGRIANLTVVFPRLADIED